MKIVEAEEKQISGISIRTTNANEMNPATAKIGALYQRFDQNVSVDYKSGARVYGVYYDYESDASGEFNVLAGSDCVESTTERLEQVLIPAGKYMVFEGKGEMPQAVIDAWSKVWEYFANENSPHQRTYTIDFECYKSQDEADVHIAIR